PARRRSRGARALASGVAAQERRASTRRKRPVGRAHTMQTTEAGGAMYSKARIAGHPIHPMLVAFPIAFYTATVATLLAYVGTHEAFWFRIGMVANMAGIVMAVVAVITGAIDLLALPKT